MKLGSAIICHFIYQWSVIMIILYYPTMALPETISTFYTNAINIGFPIENCSTTSCIISFFAIFDISDIYL